MCPGPRLEELCYKFMFQDKITEHPNAEYCTSEDQEYEAERQRKKFSRYDDEEHEKKIKHKKPMCKVDTRLEFFESLNRRSIAFHLAGVMRHTEHEQWVAKLRHATDPTNVLGSVSIGRAQIIDQHMWQLVMHTTKRGIRKTEDDMHPVFEAMKKHWDMWEIQSLMIPGHNKGADAKQGKAAKRGRSSSSSESDSEKKDRRRKRREKADAKWNAEERLWKASKGASKGGKKGSKGGKKGTKGGKKGDKKGEGRVPKELQGLRTHTKAGQPNCFGWNTCRGCTLAGPGGTCPPGRLHTCMICGQASHGASTCPKKKKE